MAEQQPTGRRLTVIWHPDAVTGAVDRATAATTAGDPAGTCELAWQDVACLVDLARTILATPTPPGRPARGVPGRLLARLEDVLGDHMRRGGGFRAAASAAVVTLLRSVADELFEDLLDRVEPGMVVRPNTIPEVLRGWALHVEHAGGEPHV